MAAKILLVGTATDGPSYEVVRLKDERHLKSLFGGGFIERFALAASASSLSITWETFAGIEGNTLDGTRNQLFSPNLSGTALTFGTLGGSGTRTVDIEYTPFTGISDLYYAARAFIRETGEMPIICRIGGETASGQNSNGWTFYAKYPGQRYNDVYVSYNGSALTVSGLEPNFPTRVYTESVETLPRRIQRDFSFGLCPIRVGAYSNTLSAFTLTLSGGSDGAVTNNAVSGFFERVHLAGEITHVVILGECSSAMMGSILEYTQEPASQPRMFLMNAPTFAAPTSSWISSTLTSLPLRSNMAALFIGTVTHNLGFSDRERYAVEGAAIALHNVRGHNITNIRVKAKDFTPKLSETELDWCRKAGFIPLNRYIYNNIGTYHGVVSSARRDFLYASKVAEVTSIARLICLPYLGRILSYGRQGPLETEIMAALRANVTFFEPTSTEVFVRGPIMAVSIEGDLPDEILQISFVIRNT